jgi:hypothetical protein
MESYSPIFSDFIDYLLFFVYGNVTFTGEGLQSLGLYWLGTQGPRAGRDIYCNTPAASVFPSHPKDSQTQSPLTTPTGIRLTCSNPDPYVFLLICIFPHI